MPRPRPWTDDQLRDAVAGSESLLAVCRVLGLTPGGRTYEQLRRHIARLDLDTSHLPRVEVRTSRVPAWDEDRLRDVVRDSQSVSAVLRQLGYAPSGGMHRHIRSKIDMLGLDTSHFLGQSWSRGRVRPQGQIAKPLDEILVERSYYNSGRLRRRLIAAGIKPGRCETCELSTWRGAPLPLELDHINGVPTDNRLQNLRVLCPNCHSQTDTWCRSRRRQVT